MTTEITEQTVQAAEPAAYVPSRWERVTLADQRRAFAALDRVTELYPNLPAAYITVSYVTPETVMVQAQSWPALEAWREGLNVPPADVDWGNCEPEREHLEFVAEVDGVRLRVYMIGDLVEQADSGQSAVAA